MSVTLESLEDAHDLAKRVCPLGVFADLFALMRFVNSPNSERAFYRHVEKAWLNGARMWGGKFVSYNPGVGDGAVRIFSGIYPTHTQAALAMEAVVVNLRREGVLRHEPAG